MDNKLSHIAVKMVDTHGYGMTLNTINPRNDTIFMLLARDDREPQRLTIRARKEIELDYFSWMYIEPISDTYNTKFIGFTVQVTYRGTLKYKADYFFDGTSKVGLDKLTQKSRIRNEHLLNKVHKQ